MGQIYWNVIWSLFFVRSRRKVPPLVQQAPYRPLSPLDPPYVIIQPRAKGFRNFIVWKLRKVFIRDVCATMERPSSLWNHGSNSSRGRGKGHTLNNHTKGHWCGSIDHLGNVAANTYRIGTPSRARNIISEWREEIRVEMDPNDQEILADFGDILPYPCETHGRRTLLMKNLHIY